MSDSSNKNPNALIHASSPYLLQHAYNPVAWNEWNSEVLKKAVAENKLLIISIGYAACHWCHVMEHESFENEEVAEWMNNFYYSIKVDREERPDIDAIYMNAAQLTTGRGGWPLNVIALPDGKPVFAGTYFPKDHWIKILQHFVAAWKKNPEELLQVAEKVSEGLHMMEDEQIPKFSTSDFKLSRNIVKNIADNIYSKLDHEKGGLNKAPKFPMPVVFDFLLNFQYYDPDEKIKNSVHATLINMLEGGIYDQVGGGFARYSVDEYWFVPHFEKMLYDNAQLISLYAKAYSLTGVEEYKRIADETINWLVREMMSDESLFYSSLDADSEGVEGKFYCFTKEEIFTHVKIHPEIFADYFTIKDEGNWEHTNILYAGHTATEMAVKYNITKERFTEIIESGKNNLLRYRDTRIRPGLDDKCITSWNALTIKGLCKAFQLLENKQAITLAKNTYNTLHEKMKMSSGLFYRNYKNKKSSIHGCLDDQVIMLQASIFLYQSTFDEKYLVDAKNLLQRIIDHYYDNTSGTFFFTGKDQEKLIVRSREITDNVIPSSNSMMAEVLYYLGTYFAHDEWLNMSKRLCHGVIEQAIKFGPYYSQWASCILYHAFSGVEVAITGIVTPEELIYFYQIPGIVIMKKTSDSTIIPLLADKPLTDVATFYICHDKTCGLPVNNVHSAVREILSFPSEKPGF